MSDGDSRDSDAESELGSLPSLSGLAERVERSQERRTRFGDDISAGSNDGSGVTDRTDGFEQGFGALAEVDFEGGLEELNQRLNEEFRRAE